MADQTIASPLNLLSEEEQAREVLLLSFTLNLEFWERYALSVARGLGARVTVVGDAAMVSGDPAHVRYAGITYQDGRASCEGGGAFHPKLLVIAGEEYATVAIGSGNATLSGWHDNAELWTVLRGDANSAPDTFVGLAVWLRALPQHVRFSAAVEPVLVRVAELLERLPGNDSGPRLLTSLDRPIIEQLPDDVVEELVVASPFYDRAGAGLQALLDRLQPGTAPRVLLQPRDVVADGSVLAELLAGHGGTAEVIASDRYHHGKLVEWAHAGRRFALTGSPNVSRPALLATLAGDGNCELALLSEIAESLAPAGGSTITHEELAAIAFSSRYEPAPSIVLLGVLRGPDRLEVTLGRPLVDTAALEYALGAVWETADTVPSGVESFESQALLAPGTAVRIRQGSITSNVCFVGNPASFNRTRIEHLGRVSTDEEDVFRDPSIADAFAHDLAELRQFLTHAPAAGAGSGGGGAGGAAAVTFTSWEEYLDACEARIGPRLLAYGLALPALGVSEGQREEADAGTLTHEEDDDGIAAPEPETRRVFDDLSVYQRRRYQRWCVHLADLSPQLPFAGRLVALRLIIDAVRGELFAQLDEWLPLVASATEALGSTGDAFEEERVRAASLAAVALAVMRSKLRRFADWEDLRFPYERAVTAVASLLENTDPDMIERYAGPLQNDFGVAVAPASVAALVDSVLLPDVIADAIRLAEEDYGYSLEREGQLLRLDSGVPGDPRRALLAIISLCETADIAVVTPEWSAHWAVAAWRKPELVMITRAKIGVRGMLYELRGFGPGTFKDDLQSLPKPKEQWTGRTATPARSQNVLQAVCPALVIEH